MTLPNQIDIEDVYALLGRIIEERDSYKATLELVSGRRARLGELKNVTNRVLANRALDSEAWRNGLREKP